jgi:translation initiation factor IF-2
LGLADVPKAGELFVVMDSERDARTQAEQIKLGRQEDKSAQKAMSLEQIFEAYEAGEAQELKLIIKADVQGSLEPIVSSLENLTAGDIGVNILHSATGNIGESDVMLAAASDAIIIGFSVSADQAAMKLAEKERVDIRIYDIIYRLTEDVEMALKGMLEPETHEIELGRAEVRAVFSIPRVGKIAGCMVLAGELQRNARMRVIRENEILHEGPISSLKHEKDDVREVREGFECGVGLKGFEAFEVGDILQCYTEETVAVV